MKISKEKRLQMEEMINASLIALPTEKKVAYVNRLRNDGRVKDMRTRISWDIAHSALGNGFLISLYDDGANDTHIDSALKALAKKDGELKSLLDMVERSA